jgi:hypothetical protein
VRRRHDRHCPVRGRPQSNAERNLCLIWCGPPPPTLRERICRAAWAVEESWQRHVTQRELYRLLDRLRLLALPEDPEFLAESRERLWRKLAAPDD